MFIKKNFNLIFLFLPEKRSEAVDSVNLKDGGSLCQMNQCGSIDQY